MLERLFQRTQIFILRTTACKSVVIMSDKVCITFTWIDDDQNETMKIVLKLYHDLVIQFFVKTKSDIDNSTDEQSPYLSLLWLCKCSKRKIAFTHRYWKLRQQDVACLLHCRRTIGSIPTSRRHNPGLAVTMYRNSSRNFAFSVRSGKPGRKLEIYCVIYTTLNFFTCEHISFENSNSLSVSMPLCDGTWGYSATESNVHIYE